MVWFKHKLSGTKRRAIELESDPKCGAPNMEVILDPKSHALAPPLSLHKFPLATNIQMKRATTQWIHKLLSICPWRYKAKTPYPRLNTLPTLVQLPRPMTIKESSSTCS